MRSSSLLSVSFVIGFLCVWTVPGFANDSLIPDGFINASNETAQTMPVRAQVEKSLRSLPEPIIDALSSSGFRLTITPTMLTALPYDRGVVPRGWSEDSNYDNVGGLFHHRNRTVYIAEKVQAMGDANKYIDNARLPSTVRHEIGHAYDCYLNGCSQGYDFAAAYDQDLNWIRSAQERRFAYYLQGYGAGRQELFAEVFAAKYTPDNERNQEQADLLRAFSHVASMMEVPNSSRVSRSANSSASGVAASSGSKSGHSTASATPASCETSNGIKTYSWK